MTQISSDFSFVLLTIRRDHADTSRSCNDLLIVQSHRGCDCTATSFWTKSRQIAVRFQYGRSVVVVGRTSRGTVAVDRWGILNCSKFLADLAATFRSVGLSAVGLRSHSSYCGRSTIVHGRAATVPQYHTVPRSEVARVYCDCTATMRTVLRSQNERTETTNDRTANAVADGLFKSLCSRSILAVESQYSRTIRIWSKMQKHGDPLRSVF